MQFAQLIWLPVGFVACAALIWRYRKFDQRQRADLAKFASDSLIEQLTASVSTARRNLKRMLIVAGVALIAVALARPLVGFRWEEAKRKGLDLLIAVDTSKSMLVQDVKPDRLTRAKMAVEDLLQKLEGDRVGLIAFAGNAFLQCPLTLDYDAFRQSLDALDTSIIPRGGTDIAAAIQEAEAALKNNGNNERILVLITDGEDLEGKALDAVRKAAKNGLKVFTVGVGNASGELIPVPDGKGGTQFMKDASGGFAKSKLDESMLKQIAEAAGGIYQPLGQQAQGLETIYREGLSKFARHDIASRMHKIYIERFQWPLALGLICLVTEPLIGIRKRRATAALVVLPSPKMATAKASTRAAGLKTARASAPALAAAAVVALFALTPFAHASTRSAEKAYAKGEFEKAAQDYRKAAEKAPQKPELHFNYGAAAYKAGQHEAAAEAFARAMKADNAPLQEDNYYNLGNTQYRLGQKTEKSNPQETIKDWEEAVKSYQAALQLKTDDADAKYNRDLVKKKLDELKKQQQQQKQDQKQDQQNQPDQKDQQNSGSSQNKQDPKDGKDQNKEEQKQNGTAGDQEQKEQNDQGKGQDQEDGQGKHDEAKGDKPEQKKSVLENQQPANSGKSDDQKNSANKEQKPEAGKDKKDQAQNQGTPEPRRDDAHQKPELANKSAKPGEKKDKGDVEDEAQRVPGKMSKLEAKQLLDSLKNGDRRMPMAPAVRGQAAIRDDEPLKDW